MVEVPAAKFTTVELTLDGSFEVLHDFNLSIPQRKVTSFLGPSGCGKTLILYLLAGFFKPNSGLI